MYDLFSEETKQILQAAEDEARNLRHSYIGTEHILLAIAKKENLVASNVMKMFKLNHEKIKEEILEIIEERPHQYHVNVDLTPLAKLVIRLAVEEAQSLGQRVIGPEHLLLGLLKCEEGVASRVFSRLNVNIKQMQQKIRGHLLSRRAGKNSKETDGSSKTPMCDAYGTDLTKLAKERKLDPVIGRFDEINRVIHILSRRRKNNPCLIGDPGVGKTAIVEGLAMQIIENKVPETLFNKRVMLLNFSSIIAGAKFRGEFEERLKTIIDEIKENQDIILFIDEIHTIVGTGSSEGSMDAANILKPVLSRGELQVIGATTMNEYRKYIEKDTALERRFQTIHVKEPSITETISILKGLRDRYEIFHRVKIADEAIHAAANMSARYISDRAMPDKAIDLVDEAGAYVRLSNLVAPPDIRSIENEREEIQKEEELAISRQDYERAAKMHCRDIELKAKYEKVKINWESQKANLSETCEVLQEDIARVVSKWTGIPITTLTQDETEKLLHLEEILNRRVIGQDHAIKSISQAVRRARAGLSDPKRPYGSFLFLGFTGVGKTELAKTLASSIYGDINALIRVDMSEYQERHTVSRFLGAPPGYVGFDEAGQLTEQVRRKPYSVILLDEIEKAHVDVFNIFLQILEDGQVTDSHGRTVNFKNCIIIMTSNVGARDITYGNRIGFTEAEENIDYETVKEKLLSATKDTFKPEFLNRIDEIVVFSILTKENVKEISWIVLEEVIDRLRTRNITLKINERVIDYLITKGYNHKMGARPMKRLIQSEIDNELANLILQAKLYDNSSVDLDYDPETDKLVFECKKLEIIEVVKTEEIQLDYNESKE